MPGQIQKTRKKLFRSWGFHARLRNIRSKMGEVCMLLDNPKLQLRLEHYFDGA